MIALLLRASVEGAIAVALIAAVSLVLAHRAPATRCKLWWITCLKFLVVLSGVAPLTLPVLPAASEVTSVIAPSHFLSTVASPGLPASTQPIPWRGIVVTFWIAGVACCAALGLIRILIARQILRHARSTTNGREFELLVRLSEQLELPRIPELRVSHDVTTPQVLGQFRPVVVLPERRIPGLDRDELAMVLCHELLHIRRRDLMLGWVPAIAQSLFFFHPGATYAARQYVLAREQACDRDVLRILGASPQLYGRLLLAMSTGPRTLATAVGVSSSFTHLRRRLLMLDTATQERKAGLLRWIAVGLLAAAVLVPIRLSASDRSTHAQKGDSAAPSPTAIGGVSGGVSGGVGGGVSGGIARGVSGGVGGGISGGVSGGVSVGDSYIFFVDKDTVMMSGVTSDIPHARAVAGDGQVLWCRENGKEYVVRDRVTLQAISELHTALGRLERGHRNRADVDRDRARREEVLAEQEKVEAAIAERRAANDAASANAAERERAVEAQSALERKQLALARELEARAHQIEAMNADREAEKMRHASDEIERQIRTILEMSIRSGAAEPVHEII